MKIKEQLKVTEFAATFLDALSADAAKSNRLRQHSNVHRSYQESCQRLFNAIEPGSYIRPHRHLHDPKTECMIAVRGLMTLVTFDDVGYVTNAIRFGAQGGAKEAQYGVGVEIPPGIWHTVIAHVPDSILFEVKAGPFDPDQAKEFADWAPEDGTLAAKDYLLSLKALVG